MGLKKVADLATFFNLFLLDADKPWPTDRHLLDDALWAPDAKNCPAQLFFSGKSLRKVKSPHQ
ncbi:MAG: hypothetical protein DI617_03090 [Streptococcus pyogenes]|nr:MAG: hypothetical protein DI617_03090 [Streptococcus pyogenes]